MGKTSYQASSSTTKQTKNIRRLVPVPTKPGAYDTSIPDDAKSVLRARSGAIHKARINDYLLYDAALRATHRFILGVIDDTYVRTLKTPPRITLKYIRNLFSGKWLVLARI